MSDGIIRPTTVDGIKRLAKRLKREKNIKHSDALNEAAQAAGYRDFIDARDELI